MVAETVDHLEINPIPITPTGKRHEFTTFFFQIYPIDLLNPYWNPIESPSKYRDPPGAFKSSTRPSSCGSARILTGYSGETWRNPNQVMELTDFKHP